MASVREFVKIPPCIPSESATSLSAAAETDSALCFRWAHSGRALKLQMVSEWQQSQSTKTFTEGFTAPRIAVARSSSRAQCMSSKAASLPLIDVPALCSTGSMCKGIDPCRSHQRWPRQLVSAADHLGRRSRRRSCPRDRTFAPRPRSWRRCSALCTAQSTKSHIELQRAGRFRPRR